MPKATIIWLILLSIACICYLIVLVKTTKQYDGSLVVTQKEDGVKLYSLELEQDPIELEHKKTIKFRVVHNEDVDE